MQILQYFASFWPVLWLMVSVVSLVSRKKHLLQQKVSTFSSCVVVWCEVSNLSQFTQYLSTFAHLLPAKLKNDIHYHKIIILTKLFKISILVEKTTKEHVSYHVPIFPVRHFREALPVTNNMCHMNGKTALEEKIKKNPSTG